MVTLRQTTSSGRRHDSSGRFQRQQRILKRRKLDSVIIAQRLAIAETDCPVSNWPAMTPAVTEG